MKDLKQRLDFDTILHIIETIPSCIFFKNLDLQYVFSTHYWNQINGYNSNGFDIYGKTDLEIRKDKQNARFAAEQDKEILRTGKGCRYVIKSDVDDTLQYLEILKEPVRDDTGKIIGIVGLINDVTEKTLLQERARELAEVDHLTQIYNRQTGTEKIQESLKKSPLNKVFCILDVNNFKRINDTFGHNAGDITLIRIAKALKECVRGHDDIVMRLGGDEFVMFVQDITEAGQVAAVMDRLFQLISRIRIEEYPEIFVSVSIGVERSKEDSTFDSLYLAADKKMYDAKVKFGNTYVV